MSHRKVKVLVEVLVDTDLSELEENAPHLWPEEQTQSLIQAVQQSLEKGQFSLTQQALIPKDAHASNEDYSSYLTDFACEFDLEDSVGLLTPQKRTFRL